MEYYRQKQKGRTALMILSFPMAVIIVLFIRGISRGNPVSSLWEILLAGVVMGLFMLLMSWMEIIVQEEHIEIILGPGLYRKKIDIRNIRNISEEKIPWYSSGVKRIHKGWLIGVDSSPALRLEFKNGKFLVLGTEDPGDLTRAIKARMDQLN